MFWEPFMWVFWLTVNTSCFPHVSLTSHTY
jgi:hypothetical protein